jgi:hypothetical protein
MGESRPPSGEDRGQFMVRGDQKDAVGPSLDEGK